MPHAPGPGEPPEAYLARLRGEQRRRVELIAALERGLEGCVAPVMLPPHQPPPDSFLDADPVGSARERRAGPERRAGRDRRAGRRDRRRGALDTRAERVERRTCVRDRRTGMPNRRFGGDRRGTQRAIGAGAPVLDPTLVFWAVNVLCWVAVAVVALVWGGQ